MSAWANRRKGLYVSGILLVLLLLFGGIAYSLLSTAPTCSDGRQDGREEGIDCGGACKKICPFKTSPATVMWARSVEVTPGVWTAIAYVNNPNESGAVLSFPYDFKLYDEGNILVVERKGTTFLSPGQVNVIVEPGITTGNRTPSRTFFEFSPVQNFTLADDPAKSILIGERGLSEAGASPKLTVTISNTSLRPIQSIEATAVIFNENGNAMAASRTVVRELPAQGSNTLTFTWPRPFTATSTTVDVKVRVRPL